MTMKKQKPGRPPGPSRSGMKMAADRRRMDIHIREIFEEEATRKDALAKAIRYMFENDPIVAVHAYLRLMSIKQTASPISNVTNIFAEQVNAPQLVAHMEDLACLAAGPGDEALVQDQLVLPADSGSETH